MSISQRENYMGKFSDKRLDKRAAQLSSILYFGRSSSVHEITMTEAEQKAANRFLSNEKVEEKILIDTVKARSSYLCEGKDVLYIEQLFRLLKKKGFKIETSELESDWAIRKLTVIILNFGIKGNATAVSL